MITDSLIILIYFWDHTNLVHTHTYTYTMIGQGNCYDREQKIYLSEEINRK